MEKTRYHMVWALFYCTYNNNKFVKIITKYAVNSIIMLIEFQVLIVVNNNRIDTIDRNKWTLGI